MKVMTELIGSPKVLKVYPSFILGKCRCGCNEDVPIRSTGGILFRYKIGHVRRNKDGIIVCAIYNLVRDRNHPNGDHDGYLGQHVYNFTVRDGQLFCCMLKWGHVHHKDGNKKNNDLCNLEGMTASQHTKHHNPVQDHSHKRCIHPDCKTPWETTYSKGSPNWYNWTDGLICHKCYVKEWHKKQKLLKKKLL